MVEKVFRQMSKQKWYKWSFYINIVLFLIIIIATSFLVIDSYNAGKIAAVTSSGTDELSQAWINITRDIGFLLVALALIFFQFFKNLMTIVRRSL
ncbi:MAG: hypothetical protein JSW62_02455 [Thermoplasmatales archaeon]|nr:MAG: hypothetical protein JSW62_02455 [Thermoplasmatales archaeon]